MRIRTVKLTFGLFLFGALVGRNLGSQDPTDIGLKQVLALSEADERVWLERHIARGMPTGETLTVLALRKPQLVLPILEATVEKIVRSPHPRELFSDPTVNPDRVAALAEGLIVNSGVDLAFIEEARLLDLDEVRFGPMIAATLYSAKENPYSLAYRGLALESSGIRTRIIEWTMEQLTHGTDASLASRYKLWAEALVNKYDHIPGGQQFANDPIAHELKPSRFAAIEGLMKQLMTEAWANRKRQ